MTKLNEYQIYKSGPRKGQPKTLRDRVVRYVIEGLHYKEVPSKSKYRQFEHFRTKEYGTYYFVGKAGGLRMGKTASNSISVTHNMKLWERWERKERK